MQTTTQNHAQDFRSRISRPQSLRAIALAILSLATGVQLAQIVIAARSRGPTPDQRSFGHSGTGANIETVDAQLNTLARAHLFGVSNQPVMQTSAVVANLQWTLSGTLTGSSPEHGSAIVGERGKAAFLRSVGEEISSGFKLVQVRAEGVVLDRNGQRVTVSFTGNHASRGGIIFAGIGREEVSQAQAVPAVWHPHKGWPQNRPPALVALRPQMHLGPDGHYNGMRVMGVGDGSALLALGLQRGDVITQVNGKPLRQPGDSQLALAQMSTGTPVTVTVERDGTTQQLALAVPDSHD